MSEELAIKIFKQFDFEIEICEKCPRKKEKERTCIGCLENAKESLLNYIEQLQQENEELKKQIEIKNSGYMASIEEVCEYATALIEFEKWLEERYKQQTETLNKMEEDNIERPYVKSRRYLVEECLDKLQELKGSKK